MEKCVTDHKNKGNKHWSVIRRMSRQLFNAVVTAFVMAVMICASYQYLGAEITFAVIVFDVAIGCWVFYEMHHAILVNPDEEI